MSDDLESDVDTSEAESVDDPFDELGELYDLDFPVDDIATTELFESMDVPAIDDDSVWEEVLEGRPEPGSSSDEGLDGAVRDVVVSKTSYCHTCEYLSEPPGLACSNPETEIVEVVDVDRFRVRNCPVVGRRRRSGSAASEDV